MQIVNITSIENNLPNRTITLQDDNGESIFLAPGEILSNSNRISLQLIRRKSQVSPETIRLFSVEGFPMGFAYAAVLDQGLISALGVQGDDFFPEDEHLTHVTVPGIQADQNIHLSFEVNEIADGTLVTWVLGTVDEV